jgi:hypothetical protein
MPYEYPPFVSPPEFYDVRRMAIALLTENRLPRIFSIDGHPGAGKSTLSGWLSWQLSMPVVHLDMFLLGNHKIEWSNELVSVLRKRPDEKRPVIVEGCGVDDALRSANMVADLKVFVTDLANKAILSGPFKRLYRAGQQKRDADHHLVWQCPELVPATPQAP